MKAQSTTLREAWQNLGAFVRRMQRKYAVKGC